jgi:hypothetical protein
MCASTGRSPAILEYAGAPADRRHECSRVGLVRKGERVRKQVRWQLARMGGTWWGSWKAAGHVFDAEHVSLATYGAVAQ